METLIVEFISRTKPSLPTGYAATTLMVLFTAVVAAALSPELEGPPFLLFTAPVALSSFLFDRGAGFYATGLGTLLGIFFFVEPSGSLILPDPDDLLGAVIFVVIGFITAAAVESLRLALVRTAMKEREKGVMLRELNHRVRNDLQTLSALLRVSARTSTATPAILHEAADRIVVMGRVYDRLGNHDGHGTIRSKDFLEGLVADLHKSVGDLRPIGFFVEAADLDITVRCATALGLIVNELVTNAIKYAFPAEQAGSITVTFGRIGDAIVLSVEDDGVGLPPDSAPQGTGLGQKLVQQLVAQNQGILTLETANGVKATIRFPRGCLAT